MATVKVKFRPSTVAGKAGTVYYQLSHRRKNLQITTSIRLFPEQWDASRARVAPAEGCPALLEQYRHRIDCDLLSLRRIIQELDSRPGDYALADIVALFRSSDRRTLVLDYMEGLIDGLRANRRLGTACNYRRAARSFSAFLGGRDIPFSMLDEQLVMAYDTWLQKRHVMRNTVSFYMRVLRSVFNKAVRQRIVGQSFPFRNVYTGVDRTNKRAVDETIVLRLQRLDLRSVPSLALARDLFLFSYGTRGMAFVDIAYLRKSEVAGGVITYSRRKTGQSLAVRVEPCVGEIIRRYAACTRGTPYVFPLLTSEEAGEAFRQYKTALSCYNRRLKTLARMADVAASLSSYVPRHTWATMARNRQVPLSVISAGMGHTSEKTTRIYLASLENSVIDSANRMLLAGLNAGRTPR